MGGSRTVTLATFLGIAVICFIFVALVSERAEIRVCNSAPYLTEHVVVASQSEAFESLGGWFRLGSGECVTKEKRFWWVDPAFYVHTQVPTEEQEVLRWVNDIVDAQLLGDDEVANDSQVMRLQGHEISQFGDFAICARQPRSVPSSSLQLQESCPANTYEARVMPAFTLDDPAQWYFVWEHPNLPLMPADGSFEGALEKAMGAARQLRTSVSTQRLNEREWGSITPFSVGGTLEDHNGPLALGVWVTGVPSTTIFGQLMPIQSGDAILRVNGRPVLGASDLNQLLINHGLSRTAGIEVPVQYLILRGDQTYHVSTTYFFNEQYRQASPDQRGVAFWYGIGDALTFGQTPWVTCYGSNGLRRVGKGLSMAAELLSSKIEGRAYDSSKEAQVEYIDAEECTWQKKQARAFARQKADSVYINSQWFAIVTPSAFRLVGGRALGATRLAGRSAMSRAAMGGMLEAAETALWSVGTAAPGTPLSRRLGEAARMAPLGAAGGFIGTAAMRYRSR